MNVVSMRRLWPGRYPEGPFELPADEAEVAMAAGLVIPMLPDGEPVTVGPLGKVIRSALACDAELRELATTAARSRGSVLRGAVAPPRRIAPASFADERFRVVYGDRPEEGWYCRPPQWTSDVRNPGRVLLARHIARRRAELLTDVFERLRSGQIATVATAPATGLRASVSADVWSSPGVVLDLRDSALWAGQAAVFLGVEAAPSRPRGASRSAIEQSVAAFDAAMLEAERRFTVGELVDAARTVLGDVSGLEIEAALRRAPVSARAGTGRRPARETPTAAELADAAGRAAPTHS